MDPIIAQLATKTGKEILDFTKPQQGIFWNYIFLNWFGGKKMAISNEIAKAEIENAYDFKKLEGKIQQELIIQYLQSSDTEVDYRNLFGTLIKTLPKISEDATGNIDPDKIKRLKDLSKEYSSDEMQEYIAKILAGEYNKPGTYSLQTMDIIKTLSKDEIEIFQKFKSIIFDGDSICELLFRDIDLMGKFNINYHELLLLSSLNLIAMNSSVRWLYDIGDKTYGLEYNGKTYGLKYTGKKTINDLYFLTRAGRELYGLLDNNFNQTFVDYLIEFFKGKGVELINLK